MRRTFLLICALIFGSVFTSLAQQKTIKNEAEPTKAKATQVTTEHQKTVRDAERQPDTATLNDQIDRKRKEIEEIENHLKSMNSNPDYNPAASKKRLEAAQNELKELKKKTL